MIRTIEVAPRPGTRDSHAADVLAQVADLGIASVTGVRTARLFHLETDEPDAEVERIARELLADPVVETYRIDPPPGGAEGRAVVVRRKPGVMDPVAESTRGAIADMGLTARRVATAREYVFEGDPSRADLETIAAAVLANDCVEDVAFSRAAGEVFPEAPAPPFHRVTVDLRDAADADLERLSRQGGLFLSLAEMRAVQDHFTALGRDPTDLELETFAQTWSEHCVHKTLRGRIRFGEERIDNLLKSTVFRVTRDLDRPWCVSVFADGSGVVEFDGDWCVCFKVETHNHPSALEPYGGAATGIGGVIRDPLGTGLGARPMSSTRGG